VNVPKLDIFPGIGIIRNMTRQKFYEYVIMKTFEFGFYEVDETLSEKFEKLGYHEGMSFKELVMKWSLLGENSIPSKENFKKWGIAYVCQLLGFVERSDDLELMREYFSFLRKNKKLYKKEEWKKFGDLCWEVLIKNVTTKRTFAEEISSFILFEFKDSEWFKEYFKMAFALSLFNFDATDEAFRVKCGKSPFEAIGELVKNSTIKNG